MSNAQSLNLEQKQAVLILSVDRPKVNALCLELVLDLQKAFQRAERDNNVRCVLLTGVGDNFSAGQDLFEFQSAGETTIRRHLLRTYNPLILQIRRLPKPVVAAINGAAAGAGLGLALACDLRIASENARFFVGFNSIGLAPDSAVSLLLPALIGLGRAAEYTFTNRPIHADQALEWGLVNRVVPAEQLTQVSLEVADGLSNGPVGAMGLSKRAFNKAMLGNLEQVLDYEAHLQEIAGKGQEHTEGLAAFLEKRPPRFIV